MLIVDDCGLVSVHRSFTPANHPKLERLVVSGNPGLDAKSRAKVDAFAETTTKNGGWVRGECSPRGRNNLSLEGIYWPRFN